MQNELKVALVQTHLAWENPTENRKLLEEKINSISQPVDLIVLPEMFTTGFTMNASENAESMQGQTLEWLKNLTSKTNAAITGSIIVKDNENYFNRLLFVLPNGNYKVYDKRHTFTLAGEDKVYTAGKDKLIVDYKGWKICPLICYDLRFPVWARNIENYDLLIYVANWPKVRINAWSSLLKTRAIENMSYTIGVNRVGLDVNNYEYSGHSAAFDVLGNEISNIKPSTEQIEVITLNKAHIKKYRDKLQFLNDRDSFNLEV